MKLHCEKCADELHGRDVDFSGEAPQCRRCGSVVSRGRRRRNKSKVALPPSISVHRVPHPVEGMVLSIVVPWRLQHPQAATQLVFGGALFVIGYLLEQARVPLAVTAGLLLLPVGAFFAIRLVNRTLITVSKGAIVMRHGPFPWLGRKLDARAIEQLYVDRRPLAQHRFDYSVKALVDGDETIFFRSLSDPIAALYLEQCIEGYLNIDDVAVSGEVRPSQLLDEPSTESPVSSARPR